MNRTFGLSHLSYDSYYLRIVLVRGIAYDAYAICAIWTHAMDLFKQLRSHDIGRFNVRFSLVLSAISMRFAIGLTILPEHSSSV